MLEARLPCSSQRGRSLSGDLDTLYRHTQNSWEDVHTHTYLEAIVTMEKIKFGQEACVGLLPGRR